MESGQEFYSAPSGICFVSSGFQSMVKRNPKGQLFSEVFKIAHLNSYLNIIFFFKVLLVCDLKC